ncbi:hypothetical protein A6D6_01136 [Alcanivorax xiamenensis]|uniref:Lipoprotein n=1 Tax=Alcanivorax xiamenensis TaxID=1177156 RepID=A0ABQ6YBY7_9GAMM|nr:hypothetical protein [Alcanivorax xiamenensis]KAF0807137.1 hypothetical protein A6D6_01136 [Alcanivorax xiamenensis]
MSELKCLGAALLALSLTACGGSGGHHSSDAPESLAGLYQGAFFADDGGASWITALVREDGSALLAFDDEADGARILLEGQLDDTGFDGIAEQDGQAGEPVHFTDEDTDADVVRGELSLGDLNGTFVLQRDEISIADDPLAGDYVFVDEKSTLWSVRISDQGLVSAQSGDCAFEGSVTEADSGRPASLALAAGACAPFTASANGALYLERAIVGDRDALRVVVSAQQPHDYLWFRD